MATKKKKPAAPAVAKPKAWDPPIRMHITSDDTKIEFVRVQKISENEEEHLYVYRYTQAEPEKLNTETKFSKSYIERQLRNYFKVI